MFPIERLRRLRRNESIRALVREHALTATDFIQGIFVIEGEDICEPIEAMPGICRYSLDRLPAYLDELYDLGLRALLFFGIPAHKDACGSEAYAENGIVQSALRLARHLHPDFYLIADVCLCEYTDHGHCGLLNEAGEVRNDASLELLARTAVSQAAAGADCLAPSAMMDGQVAAIRRALDEAGYEEHSILAYSAKFASAFYGPFRAAAGSAPKAGSDRKAYQMDPANGREAMREVLADQEEGCDMIMVKPAMSYLDILYQIRQRSLLPLVAYQVSGEYAMIHAAAAQGWIDGARVMDEALLSLKRAGADMIVSYAAADYLRRHRS